jgi:hypothetical protein
MRAKRKAVAQTRRGLGEVTLSNLSFLDPATAAEVQKYGEGGDERAAQGTELLTEAIKIGA